MNSESLGVGREDDEGELTDAEAESIGQAKRARITFSQSSAISDEMERR